MTFRTRADVGSDIDLPQVPLRAARNYVADLKNITIKNRVFLARGRCFLISYGSFDSARITFPIPSTSPQTVVRFPLPQCDPPSPDPGETLLR